MKGKSIKTNANNTSLLSFHFHYPSPEFPPHHIILNPHRLSSGTIRIHNLLTGDSLSQKSSPYYDQPVTGSTRICSIALIAAAFTSFLSCSLPVGFNIGVINTPQKILKTFCNDSLNRSGHPITRSQLDLLWSAVVSIFLIGSMIGSGFTAKAAAALGRRPSIIAASIISLIGGGFFLASKQFDSVLMILLGRLLCGIHCGLSATMIPMYLMEISPKKYRQLMGVLPAVGMATGILISQVLGQESLLGNKTNWPVLLSFYTVFIMMGFTALLWVPESPVYIFLTLDDETRAIETMKYLYGPECENEAVADLHALKQEKKMSNDWSMMKVICDPSLRKSVILLCMIHIGQQMSGVNAIFYYSTKMFENVGFSEHMSQMGSIAIGTLNVIIALIALPVLNTFKNKTLLVSSLLFSAIFLTSLTVTIHLMDQYQGMASASIVCVMAYILAYGLGLGPIAYMIGAELFESGPAPFAMALGSLLNWTFNFVVGLSFPSVEAFLKEYVYLIFSGSCIILLVTIVFCLESKDDSPPIEEVVRNSISVVVLPPDERKSSVVSGSRLKTSNNNEAIISHACNIRKPSYPIISVTSYEGNSSKNTRKTSR